MAGVEDGGDKEVGPGAQHKYRICEITESNGKGRPKRIELMAWDDLSDDDVERVRQLNEPRLKRRQVAELDGRTVARGAEVSAVEVEASEPAPSAANLRASSPMEFAEFAHRMAWDVYQRGADASDQLRAQVLELNQRALEQQKQVIEQGKQLIELIDHLRVTAQRQPPAAPQGRPMTLEDISKLIQVGAVAVREIIKPGT